MNIRHLTDTGDKLEAVHSRHTQVRDGQVRPLLKKESQGCPTFCGNENLMPVLLQLFLQKEHQLLLIVHNQYLGPGHHPALLAINFTKPVKSAS